MQQLLEKLKMYPYWRTGSMVALVVIIIAGIGLRQLYLSYEREKRNTENEAGKNAQFLEPQKDRDTDGDGLPDWEEALYGADIHNKDTDGDGTLDGTEIAKGRDPTKKAPNDKLPYLQDIEKYTVASTTNTTISKEEMAKFFAAQETALQKEAMQKLVGQFDPSLYKPAYQALDLKINSNNDPESIRVYVNTFGDISKRYAENLGYRNEEAILVEAVKTKSSVTLQELQYPVVGYRNFAKEIKDIPVPSSLANYHLQIMNGYDVMSRALIGLQAMFAKPIVGAGAYQVYMTSRFEVTKGFMGIMTQLRQKNISFTEKEGGYRFNPASTTPNATATQ